MAISISLRKAISLARDKVTVISIDIAKDVNIHKSAERTRDLLSVVFPGQAFSITVEKGRARITVPDEFAQELLEDEE